MSPEVPLNNILNLPEVRGFALVSSGDGSIIGRGGITPGNIDEIVAFVGSAAEIITESCGFGSIDCIKGIGVENVVIVPYNNNYLGCVLEKDKRNIEKDVMSILGGKKDEGDFRILNLVNSKISQLNMLIEEFTKDSDKAMWQDYIGKGLLALSKGSRFQDNIILEDFGLKVSSAGDLTSEEVNKFMKLLLDFIVKKAIGEFGSTEAKERVHRVIKKIGKKK
jgi:hypothetical protein